MVLSIFKIISLLQLTNQ